ncbi:hypothetical protein [Novipirellula aureliae]|nr:hypothetical protein [Novipirellula aureliae]
MFGVLLASVCLAMWKAQVDGSPTWLGWVAILMPAIIVALLHRRFQLSLLAACAILYAITIAWGFVGGVTYSLHWIRTPHDFFERNTLGVERPLRYGLLSAQIWLLVGAVYVAIYATLVWLVSEVALDRFTNTQDGG